MKNDKAIAVKEPVPAVLIPMAREHVKPKCVMCELYEAKERELRASIQSISELYAESEGRLAQAMQWKVWFFLALVLAVIVICGVTVRP